MTVIKNHEDTPKNEKNNWGGKRQDCPVIETRADQWCKDNGYPIRKRKRTKHSLKNTESYIRHNFILP